MVFAYAVATCRRRRLRLRLSIRRDHLTTWYTHTAGARWYIKGARGAATSIGDWSWAVRSPRKDLFLILLRWGLIPSRGLATLLLAHFCGASPSLAAPTPVASRSSVSFSECPSECSAGFSAGVFSRTLRRFFQFSSFFFGLLGLDTTRGGIWLHTTGGGIWLHTTGGGIWLHTTRGGIWLDTTGGGIWLNDYSDRTTKPARKKSSRSLMRLRWRWQMPEPGRRLWMIVDAVKDERRPHPAPAMDHTGRVAGS